MAIAILPPQRSAVKSAPHDKAVPARRGGLIRRIVYRLFGLLSPRWQGLAVRIAAPKVTLGACAVIEDARGRLLVAHHTYRRRAWGLPGGLVGGNEQPAAALARELREELGVAATVGPLLYAETYAPGHHMTLYYRVTLADAPREDGVEIDGLRYVAPEDVVALMGMPAQPWMATPERMAS